MFSNRFELRTVHLRTLKVTSALSGLKNAIAFDYLYNRDDGSIAVFWSDITHDKIFRGTLSNGCELRKGSGRLARELGTDVMFEGCD